MNRSNFVMVTLTNHGYIKYTENALKSLISIKFPLSQVVIYAMDDECAEYFQKNYGETKVKKTKYKNRLSVSYQENDWNQVTLQKINAVYDELKENVYVVLFDGDIVFNTLDFVEHLTKEMNANSDLELLVQHEFKNNSSKELCSGFYCAKSTPNMLEHFDPKHYIDNKFKSNDQDYLNIISKHFKWKFLDIKLFPNGCYYYDHHKNKNQAYLVHFNFVKFNEKQGRMKRYDKWFLI